MSLELAPAFSDFRTGETGKAYNEAAFRHFLAVDRRRAERAKRSVLLILVKLRQDAPALSDHDAAALFAGLGACTREVDFIGWYREGRVAAAVMTQGAHAPADVLQLVTERTLLALAARLSAEQSRNLRVRVIRLGSGTF